MLGGAGQQQRRRGGQGASGRAVRFRRRRARARLMLAAGQGVMTMQIGGRGPVREARAGGQGPRAGAARQDTQRCLLSLTFNTASAPGTPSTAVLCTSSRRLPPSGMRYILIKPPEASVGKYFRPSAVPTASTVSGWPSTMKPGHRHMAVTVSLLSSSVTKAVARLEGSTMRRQDAHWPDWPRGAPNCSSSGASAGSNSTPCSGAPSASPLPSVCMRSARSVRSASGTTPWSASAIITTLASGLITNRRGVYRRRVTC